MSFTIAISFPGGRFHATPWGHHVNEGAAEWPPSPWRLLRTLVAVWKRTLPGDDPAGEAMPSVLAKLLEPPLFRLPRASLAQTRHFMPLRTGRKTFVIDGFLALDPDSEVIIHWPAANLSEEETRVMERVLRNMNHFGRCESICSARVAHAPDPARMNCFPADSRPQESGDDADPVRVLCADPETAILDGGGWSGRRRGPILDPDWPLCMETADLHKGKWSDPPGSRWVTYFRPADAFSTDRRPLTRRTGADGKILAARYLVDGAILPRALDTIYVGEIARRFLQGVYGRLFDGEPSERFSGKRADGRPLSGHRHAFFLPSDEDGDGRIDHLTVYCPEGFSKRELAALDRFTRMRRPGGGVELNLLLIGLLDDDAIASEPSVPLLGESAEWRSVTPFVPVRHYKKRGRKRDRCTYEEFPAVVLAEEIERRGLPRPAAVERLLRFEPLDHAARRPRAGARNSSWLEFRRERISGGGRRGGHPGGGYLVCFPEPVRGPIALGYGCHFGLGLFAAV